MSVNKYDATTGTLTKVAGNATVPIDDTTPSTDKVYSSTKVESLISNPNLLDNPFFTVNQRGLTTLNCASYDTYFVDRWNCANCSYTVFNKKANGVNISSNNSDFTTLDQKIEHLEAGTYTFSCNVSECGVDSYRLYVCDANIGIASLTTNGTGIKTLKFTTTSDKSDIRVRIYIDPVSSNTSGITIKCAKLEKGTLSTLANDVAPNYSTELVKCQTSKADTDDTYANKVVATTDSAEFLSKSISDISQAIPSTQFGYSVYYGVNIIGKPTDSSSWGIIRSYRYGATTVMYYEDTADNLYSYKGVFNSEDCAVRKAWTKIY